MGILFFFSSSNNNHGTLGQDMERFFGCVAKLPSYAVTSHRTTDGAGHNKSNSWGGEVWFFAQVTNKCLCG
jgi:hypothetical protein